ncbi:MAG: peptide deformylase [Clostridia bacterium]|nr:peptide deformylase [Clostridia bacterium]
MALRNILPDTNELLHKECKKVTIFDDNLHTLIDDMRETMYANKGVGLAAPQVGILKQVCVVDTGENNYTELINPEIIYKKGICNDLEGCLSVKGVWGYVDRPKKIIVKAFDRFGKEITVRASDYYARAICHEIDHLHGIVFTDIMTERYVPKKKEKGEEK